jgi:hypothetical protein
LSIFKKYPGRVGNATQSTLQQQPSIDSGFASSISGVALVGLTALPTARSVQQRGIHYYAKAVERAETVLLPAFDSWRTGTIPGIGTLFDDQTGAPFFPVLMAELDALKRTRIAGLMLRRNWGKHDPVADLPKGRRDRPHPHEPRSRR